MIFGENRKKEKKLGKHGSIRLSVGHPRRDVALRRSVGCLATARLREAKLALLGTLGVALLCRGVDTIHRGKIFGFCFRAPRIHILIV